MKHINRYTLGVIAALAFTGCGAQVAPTGGAPQSLTPATHGKSWMKPRTSGPLIYAAAVAKSYVLTYPDGKLVGTINDGATDACSDSEGDVFLTVDSRVDEFTHGATTPSASLTVPGTAFGCGVDGLTGNLAVVFLRTNGNDVAVFPNASGIPTLYNSNVNPLFCGYDNQGNLFVDSQGENGVVLGELPSGGSSFSMLTINPVLDNGSGTIQWDGAYLTIESGMGKQARRGRPLRINRLSISGSTATVVSATSFKGTSKIAYASWVYNNRILVPYGTVKTITPNIGYWKYPMGGKPVQLLKTFAGKGVRTNALTISTAP